MNRALVSLLILSAIALSAPRPAMAIVIDTVPVGNVGNANDPAIGGSYGGVGYAYKIGTTEVTNAQYVVFLNAKAISDPLALYNNRMGDDPRGGITQSGVSGSFTYAAKTNMGNKPVSYVSWYDVIRFANWLHNGQGGGDTETGAYELLGGTPTPSNGSSITRNAGARWFIPTENEWYKSAFHQPAAQGGDTDNYWAYATRTNSIPYSDQPPGSDAPTQSNTANFYKDDGAANNYDGGYAVTGSPTFSSSQNYLTDAGAYNSSVSPYGTLDQGGNVWEWNDALISDSFRGVRGGSWTNSVSNTLLASLRDYVDPTGEIHDIGFRVATAPEPSTILLLVVAAVGIFGLRRRSDT